ncbi:MAG: hypothetical protein LBR67_07735 [Dysgonamonadaceae bacterium]|jgi:hypothetical protein|nr:hypothetical protein [Dysgonamonadaceae bacterium]
MTSLKRLLFVLLIVLCTSCTTKEYISDEDTFDYYEITYEIGEGKKLQWELYDGSDGLYFFCEIKEPVLSSNMYSYGTFVAYHASVLEGVGERLTPLPYDVYSMDNGYRWTEQYTCEYSVGYITFIVKIDDFNMDYLPPNQTFVVKYLINNNR